MKIVYQTDPATGEYVGETYAQESPLQPGVFLIPPAAYEDYPLPAEEGYAVVREGGVWKYVEDHRGKRVYLQDGESVTWEELGPLPANVSEILPPESETEPHIPKQVTRAQGKASLIMAGLWQDVLNAVEAIEDPIEKALTEVGLNDATHWERSSPMLNMLATALGLSEEDLDDLFIQASQIQL